MNMLELFFNILILTGIIAVLLIIYDNLFRPWKSVERSIKELEDGLKILEKGGLGARIYTWLNGPWLRGDVEKHKKLIKMLISVKERELVTYYFMRGDEDV